MDSAALPPPDLLQQQTAWLAPARSRLLRQVGIAHRRRILDLGAGYGAVTAELARRGGEVVALDREWRAVRQIDTAVAITGDAYTLPFARASFDLVFCQCILLWLVDLTTAVSEIKRVLQAGGTLVALEPDYGGMIEHPPEIVSRDLWITVLQRLGADPFVGRKLPGVLSQMGWRVRVRLLDELKLPADGRFTFLRTLPLTENETTQLNLIEQTSINVKEDWAQIAHLPFFLITAERE